MALDRQLGQKRLILLTAHPLGMPKTMKAHKGTNPMDVGFFGAYAVVQVAHPLTHLFGRRLGGASAATASVPVPSPLAPGLTAGSANRFWGWTGRT